MTNLDVSVFASPNGQVEPVVADGNVFRPLQMKDLEPGQEIDLGFIEEFLSEFPWIKEFPFRRVVVKVRRGVDRTADYVFLIAAGEMVTVRKFDTEGWTLAFAVLFGLLTLQVAAGNV